MNITKYNKAIAACIPAVIGLLALFGVDGSDTVNTLAAVLIAAGPLIVGFWPANSE